MNESGSRNIWDFLSDSKEDVTTQYGAAKPTKKAFSDGWAS